jgi:hypothetical protein
MAASPRSPCWLCFRILADNDPGQDGRFPFPRPYRMALSSLMQAAPMKCYLNLCIRGLYEFAPSPADGENAATPSIPAR